MVEAGTGFGVEEGGVAIAFEDTTSHDEEFSVGVEGEGFPSEPPLSQAPPAHEPTPGNQRSYQSTRTSAGENRVAEVRSV